MNNNQSIFNKKVLIAFAECLILSLPLASLIFLDSKFLIDFGVGIGTWIIGLTIFILASFFYFIFCKKFDFKLEVFFYSLSFTFSCFLLVQLSTLPLMNREPTIPGIISTLFYAFNLPSIFSISRSAILAFYVIPFITLFYLFAISSKNGKTNRGNLLIFLLAVFTIISFSFCLLLDLTLMACILTVCAFILPTTAVLYVVYYSIYRKLPSLHIFSLIPIFSFFLTLLVIIIFLIIWGESPY